MPEVQPYASLVAPRSCGKNGATAGKIRLFRQLDLAILTVMTVDYGASGNVTRGGCSQFS